MFSNYKILITAENGSSSVTLKPIRIEKSGRIYFGEMDSGLTYPFTTEVEASEFLSWIEGLIDGNEAHMNSLRGRETPM